MSRENDFMYITSDELSQYEDNLDILKGIEEERARDGIFSSEVFDDSNNFLVNKSDTDILPRKTARDLFLEEQRGKSVSEAASVGVTDEGVFSSDAPIGRASEFLYTSLDEEENLSRAELEMLDEIRGLSHDGITYKSAEEVLEEQKRANEVRQTRLTQVMNRVFEAVNPSYCDFGESASLLNPNKDVIFDEHFINNSSQLLVGSRLYSTGNSGRVGTNFNRMEEMLDSLQSVTNGYVDLIENMTKDIEEKMSTDGFSDKNYSLYVNYLLVLSMIVEKGYDIDKAVLSQRLGEVEPFVMGVIDKINYSLENGSSLNQSIVPNPVSFVSDVSGSEYVDIRDLGMQLIAAYNTGHRISDDRTKYTVGRVGYAVPEGSSSLSDVSNDFIESSNFTRVDGRYGYYTKYAPQMLGKKTVVVDELTGAVSQIVYKERGADAMVIDYPTAEDIDELAQRSFK